LIDIQTVARAMDDDMRVGLRQTVQHYLGFNPPKGSQITLGDWEAPWLSDAQINYAVLDALYVGEVFRKMRSIHPHNPWG
jgi:ribonuclease D